MTKLRSQGPPPGPVPLDTDLAEFESRAPVPVANASFREELRASLWQLLKSLVARLQR